MTALLVALAGSAGAICRFVLDGHIRAQFNHTFPWATVVINFSGSFVLGVVSGILLKHRSMTILSATIGTGFCGGYTTFSTASFETVRLIEERRLGAASLNAFGAFGVTLLGAGVGIALGQLF